MKSILKNTFLVVYLVITSQVAFCQGAPPPPPPGGGAGGSNNQPAGGGAPIGSGVTILFALGAAYSGKKIYTLLKVDESKD